MTGRENIFLNGAILGMTRKEIKKKFDEIVDFAGIERYVDTPVKRYSSGMYVRLAFAVAAHLEPEILIVDEVLAVGDAEFQKKCLGKMKDVSVNEGRTVLFVSHNMAAVKSLCNSCLWVQSGEYKLMGKPDYIIKEYLVNNIEENNRREIDCSNDRRYENNSIKFIKIAVLSSDSEIITVADPVTIYFEFIFLLENAQLNMSIVIYTREDVCVFNSGSKLVNAKKGRMFAKCYIPPNFLNDEFYTVRILVVKDASVALIDLFNVISFEVIETTRKGNWYGKWLGVTRPNLEWEFENNDKL